MTGFRISDSGVSEVVGEMLMIGLAIVLISVFASVLGNFLPAAHDPAVTILLTREEDTITLWHKGGDWARTEDLTVVVGNDTFRKSFTQQVSDFAMVPEKDTFRLGSNITVRTGLTFTGDETISLVTPRARIFSGTVRV